MSINDNVPILDLRPEADFLRRHRPGTVNIPLESLSTRIHELPHREKRLILYDTDEARAVQAQSQLAERGRCHVDVVYGTAWLSEGETVCGPSRNRLWEPHALLKEATDKICQSHRSIEAKRVLDIACGTGRDAVYLALRGFEVEVWDVLPDALLRCEETARRNGVNIHTRCRDVERDPTIPVERFDLIACFNFLHRPLMPSIAAAVRRGGFVVYETFAYPQRDMFHKPKSDAHLLQPGELPRYFEDWQIITSREGLAGPRRWAASLIAQKP